MELLLNPITLAIVSLGILIYSAILHEVAHGFVADRFGDPTARIMGRLTLDPRSHVDPMLSLIIPLLLFFSGSPVIFGGAKPVPVDPFNLRDGRKDMALVALAGPATNVLLALVATGIIRLFFSSYSVSGYFEATKYGLGNISELIPFMLFATVFLNIMLSIFNMLPIPPLDGSKVVSLLLPEKEAQVYLSLGNIGMFVLFFLLVFPIGGFSLSQFVSNLIHMALSILLP